MSALEFKPKAPARRFGLKGPGAPAWLAAQGFDVPAVANSWTESAGAIFVARLGLSEFFIEEPAGSTTLAAPSLCAETHPPGVYPVLRQDAAYVLSGDGVEDVLTEVCSVNFQELRLEARPVLLTSMVGVSVIAVPRAGAGETEYHLWCDPTYGAYLGKALGGVVVDCGGSYGGVTA